MSAAVVATLKACNFSGFQNGKTLKLFTQIIMLIMLKMYKTKREGKTFGSHCICWNNTMQRNVKDLQHLHIASELSNKLLSLAPSDQTTAVIALARTGNKSTSNQQLLPGQ